jgi:hypothetical protein
MIAAGTGDGREGAHVDGRSSFGEGDDEGMQSCDATAQPRG